MIDRFRASIFSLTRLACVAATAGFTVAQASAASPSQSANGKGLVEIETEGAANISVRIAEEIADTVGDGATRRVLPVVGQGALQNFTDLVQLHGIDMAILQTDVLDYMRQQRPGGGDGNVTYIAKLYNEEFHLLARAEIQGVSDLAGKTVDVDRPGSGTALTAGRVFDLLGIAPVIKNDPPQVAVEKLKKGEIAALAFVAGKPAPLFDSVDAKEGLHLLSISLSPKLTAAYLPAQITAADYPGLVAQNQPIDTVAVGAILAVANLQPLSERYRNVANFVEAFFTDFQTLLTPGHHPKWRDVNLAADVPGWRRFPPADQWLKRNAAVAKKVSPDDLRQIFERFIDERLQVAGASMNQVQKDDLFNQFQQWRSAQVR